MRTAVTIGIFLLTFLFGVYVYPWIQDALFGGRSLSSIEAGLLMPVLPAIPWMLAAWAMLVLGSRWKWHIFLVGGFVLAVWNTCIFLFWSVRNESAFLLDVWWAFGDLLLTVLAYFATGAFIRKYQSRQRSGQPEPKGRAPVMLTVGPLVVFQAVALVSLLPWFFFWMLFNAGNPVSERDVSIIIRLLFGTAWLLPLFLVLVSAGMWGAFILRFKRVALAAGVALCLPLAAFALILLMQYLEYSRFTS